VKIDLRFIFYEMELSSLKEFFEVIEKQLVNLREEKKSEFKALLKGRTPEMDEGDIDIAQDEFIRFIEHTLPRFSRNPFMVSLWAVYESSIIAVAEYIRNEKGKGLGIKDIKGDDFFKRAKKYFDHVLEYPLYTDDNELERLRMLMILRHCIAHANGRINDIKDEKAVNKIKEWEKANTGVLIEDGCIMLTEDFLRTSYILVNKSLQTLFNKVREIF